MKNKHNRRVLLIVLSCLACAGTVPAALAQITEAVVHNFAAFSPNEATPYAGVTLDSAGNLYGTSNLGGTANEGVVYKVNTAGQEIVLYSFTGGTDAGKPQGGVVLDSGGNLYGTATTGGAAKAGVVYKIDGLGKETVLYSFTGGLDEGTPYAGVIRDASGNLYGTTYYGGTYECGVLFMLDTAGGRLSYIASWEGLRGVSPWERSSAIPPATSMGPRLMAEPRSRGAHNLLPGAVSSTK